MQDKGIIISGKFSEIIVRQKHGEDIELGELLISENENSKILMQAYDLTFGSQLSNSNLELVSGMKLEEDEELYFLDEKIRSYNLALLKTLITIEKDGAKTSKQLPKFFSTVREVKREDLSFLTRPHNPLYIGDLRSGSKVLDVPAFLSGEKVLSHHILVPATTGRGKSNLTSVMLWELLKNNYAGILVLDPHDEYYGRNKVSLKDHPNPDNLVYYSINPPTGGLSLKINIQKLKPSHFNGSLSFSDAQGEAVSAYYKKYGKEWISAILFEKEIQGFMEGTLSVVKRKIQNILDIDVHDGDMFSKGVFDINSGTSTISDICNNLEKGRVVIIDTSSFSGNIEILIGSLVTSEIFSRYKKYKNSGELEKKPVISVVIEEAPRVLGKEVLERGTNIFSTIAREGRKFKMGLWAITQLPSLIPREILANMNTKIILGIEMNPERQAIIDSASQDLSSDSRSIASLDKGECIVTSNFTKFALPLKIPLFSQHIKKDLEKKKDYNNSFSGITLN